MKFIKENNGVYQFIDIDGSLHNVGANSQDEALNILNNIPKPNEIEVLKSRLISNSRSQVSKKLQATDYKVIRHRDQLDLIAKGEVITTTLSSKEYEELLKERNQLRTKSNELEALINSKRSINTLEKIKIEY